MNKLVRGLSDEVYTKLVQMADQSHRSVNQEMLNAFDHYTKAFARQDYTSMPLEIALEISDTAEASADGYVVYIRKEENAKYEDCYVFLVIKNDDIVYQQEYPSLVRLILKEDISEFHGVPLAWIPCQDDEEPDEES